MRVTRSTIQSAEATKSTIFYRASFEQVLDAVKHSNAFWYANLVCQEWDGINFKYLFGSGVIDDTLYICFTNGQMMDIPDFGEVDPESALQTVPLENLEPWIENAPDEIIRHNICYKDAMNIDVDEAADWLFRQGYLFTEILLAYKDADLDE